MVIHQKDTSYGDPFDQNASIITRKKSNLSFLSDKWHSNSKNISKRPLNGFKSFSIGFNFFMICFALIMEQNVTSATVQTSFFLEGIGYREQALQQAKGDNFLSEDADGIPYASFGGGTHIFIKGTGLVDNPQSNFVFLYSEDFDQNIMAPILSEDDSFNSHPFLGSIAYRLPSLDELIGVPMTYLSGYESMTFILKIEAETDLGPQTLQCGNTDNCKIVYQRQYSPNLYYLAPPVVYYESYTEVCFDPKSTQNLITNVDIDDKPFIDAKIGESLIDFELTIEYDEWYSQYYKNLIRGQVGEIPAGGFFNISMLWETGHSNVINTQATHCTFDNQTCYQARSVPVIFNMSANAGYSTGGMNLTVTGHGFNNENITATLDGVDCIITDYQEKSFSCQVQEASQISDLNTSYVGSNGIRRELFDNSGITWENIDDSENYQANLMLAVENPYEMFDNEWNLYKGWFIPPKTTNYRFYQTCDDNCQLYLGNVSGQVEDPVLILEGYEWTTYRNWYELSHSWYGAKEETKISEWIPLVEGEPYFFKGIHYEGGGGDHYAVAVEIEQTEMVGHHHSIKEMQLVTLQAALEYEVTRFTVTNPDDGDYYLNFQNPSDLTRHLYGPVKANASADEFKNSIKDYYSGQFGSGIVVNRTMYDINGTETTNATDATSHVFMVTLDRLINDYTSISISVISNTASTVEIDLPTEVQLSAEPLSGKFRIKCVDPEGYVSYSDDINLDQRADTNTINYRIAQGCDRFYDTTEVFQGSIYDYETDGQSFYIRFIGLNADPGQFELVDSENSPLSGTNITYNASTVVSYGTNLFYEPIPFEFIRTFEELPQLIVKVNDVPAVCHNLTCDFTYIEPVGMIHDFNYDHSTKLLELTGINLPNVTSNISSIDFALTPCTIDWDLVNSTEIIGECSNNDTTVDDNGETCSDSYDSNSTQCGLYDNDQFNSTSQCCICGGGQTPVDYETKITCTLDESPTCGTHLPILNSKLGIIPVNETLAAEVITCNMTRLIPETSLNLLGGDNLTFVGQMLPKDMATSSISIKFNDVNQTVCVPKTTASDQIVCLTDAFDKDVSVSTDLGFEIIINGLTVDQTLAVTTRDSFETGENLSPSSVSPVLKTNVTIQLPTSFPYTLAKEDFTVNATNVTNPDYVRYMNVIDVDDSAKTITTKFGGAERGQYKILIRHKEIGLIESEGLLLDVNAYVTSYSPTTGSIYGGTLLTIDGSNFGDVYTDNPVQISTNGGVDSIDCFVKTTSANQITCRIDSDIVARSSGQEGDMVVFLKTSEEATCDSDVCQWFYTSQIPILESITTAFDTSTLEWTVTVTGTDFETNTAGVELHISDVAQTTTSLSSTQAVFTISDVSTQSLNSNKLYFAVGIPENHTIVESSIEITPQLASISPNSGSVGGTIITAFAPGATITTIGIDLVDDTNSSICETLTVESYGVVKCKTLAQVINASTQISLIHDGNTYQCMNSDTTQCSYEQLSDGGYPNVTSASITDENTIVFIGTSFNFNADYNQSFAEFNGIQADSVVIDDDTQATAIFTLGVPLTNEDTAPILSFLRNDNFTQVFAESYVDLANDISMTASTSGLTCSFAGGCEYEVTSQGLASMFKHDSTSNYISICDEPCIFDEGASTSSITKCKVPAISTIYSNENFGIATESEDLDSGVYFGTAEDVSVAFDGAVLITPIDTNQECSLGMSFKEGHVGMISQVKYFMGAMDSNDKAELVNITHFQGSNDNQTFTTLFTVDANLHSGWNYYNWEDPNDYPKYRFYRFFGSSSGACSINEITFTGVETIDNEENSFTCAAKIVIDEQETSLNTVEYLGSLTTNLLAISPRHGSVVGGDSVTFSGENFISDTSVYTITIDGIDCPVTSANSTSVTCTTGSRPGLVESSLEIFISGQGLVSNNDLIFLYASFWSSDTTWGGEFAPMDGESIYVPAGLNLVVDIEKSPLLNAVIVEGSIIFTPDIFVEPEVISLTNGVNTNGDYDGSWFNSQCSYSGNDPLTKEQPLGIWQDWAVNQPCACSHSAVDMVNNTWTAEFTDGYKYVDRVEYLGRNKYVFQSNDVTIELLTAEGWITCGITSGASSGKYTTYDACKGAYANQIKLTKEIWGALTFCGIIVHGNQYGSPTTERFFDANYIFITGGKMEVGTEDFPYTSKLTITMHGLLSSPYLPIYGNKVIGVRYGTLDMHGIERTPTWTLLETTVEAGSTEITLQEEVDWQPGELIAIASTSYEPREGEHRTILTVDSTRKILTLDQPLEFKHFAETQYFGTDGEFIDMRAEVGLLSRNVVFRGDPETSPDNQYGANIFLHSNGDDSLTCRLSYIELTEVGQAFKVGRYAVHFHMIGAVHNSYAKGLGTHQGNNRAFTLHGTHYLRLEDNVAYEVKGHTVFIEDAVETNNYIKNNLIIKTKRSWSLLNTDQTPACFWITHPNNIFIDNHAAGSDRYGFWYDLQTHAMGPSANQDVCPEHDRVGEFNGNTAHSMGRYGLRIFHNMVPRTFPCTPFNYDHSNPDDPYWENPPITANFENFVGWKNNRNGAIAERVGDVRFNNFKTADNLLAGIEFSLTEDMIGEYAQINGALIVGQTNNTEWLLEAASPNGIITPRTENFIIKNVKFFNYNWNLAAPLSSCSHCFHPASSDSGGRTVTFASLSFDPATCDRKIKYQTPYRAIYFDQDGTLTGLGPNTWATYNYKIHEIWDACTVNEEDYDGVVCDESVEVRTVRFGGYSPSTLDGQALKILPYDDSIIGGFNETELQAYIDDLSNYASFDHKTPEFDWAIPFVTGHKYKLSWGQTGVDFEKMTMFISQKYVESDQSLYFVHNFTDTRDGVTVTSNGVTYENDTIPDSWDEFNTGQNLILNDTETREIHLIVNGKNKSNPFQEQSLQLNIVRCENCFESIVEVETEIGVRYWSDVSNWPNETLPAEGEEVHIESGWNMILDIEETPIFENVRINGILTFGNETDIHLRAKRIFIRAGELHIGNETHPFPNSARITLFGGKNDEAMAFDNSIEAGNKLIANVGVMKMFGKERSGKLTRLHAECFKYDTEIYVEPGLDWVEGDRIALGPTSFAHDKSEDNFVVDYNSTTGLVTLLTPLKYHHWGKSVSTGVDYNGVDMRGEVLLLSRSIVISGEDIESWGGQIITSDTIEIDNGEVKFRYGQTILDHVEIYNCSQWDTHKAAIRFESASELHSSVSNSAIHNGLGWGVNIKTSQNIILKDNVIYDFRPIGVDVEFSKNITLDGNVLMRVLERTNLESTGNMEDKRGGFAICSYFTSHALCTDISVINNIATGVTFAGFIVQGDDCDAVNPTGFNNNVAHSTAGTLGGFGAIIYPTNASPSQLNCFEASNFAAYKNYYMGAWSLFSSREVRMHHMTMIDNRQGFGSSLAVADDANQYSGSLIMLSDNKIYGETEATDCPEDGSYCKVFEKFGFIVAGMAVKGKSLMPESSSPLPMYKIKSMAPWGGMQRNYRNEFINFKDTTAQGSKQGIIYLSPYQSDYHNMVEFYDTKFIDLDGDSFAYLMDPPQGWANIKDCGNFPCTAPSNVLIDFRDTEFEGSKPRWAKDDFQVIANNSGFAPYMENCEPKEGMNAYICEEDYLGILLFESEDDDRFDRSMQPIYVSKQGTEMSNKLNSMMDHTWDGFYTGQIRASRFGSIFEASRGSVYDLTFTGTPAKKMRFTLNGMSQSMGATIRIAYPSAESRSIVKDGAIVEMNQWDASLTQYGQYGEIKQTRCGENRYIGVQNILEFYLTVNCTLQIQPRDAIQALVRMEWTFEEFFADGGTTTFIDRLTASLGIHASQVKIVSVYEGSLVVNYEIEADNTDELAELEALQNEMFENGEIDLGAAVLDWSASIVTSEDSSGDDYEPVTIETPDFVQEVYASGSNIEGVNIVTEESVNEQTVTIYEESEPEDVYTYSQTTVVVDKVVESEGPEIVNVNNLGEESNNFVIILPIALSVVIFIIAAVACRFFINKDKRDVIEAQNRAKRSKEFQTKSELGQVGAISQKEMAKLGSKQDYATVTASSNVLTHQQVTEYEAQYDPNNDFAIFGVGDPSRGGLQNLKEKMNLADGPKDDAHDQSSSSDDSETDKDRASGAKNEDFRTGTAGSQNSNTKMLDDNALPEDKEIQSENGEWEE